MLSDLSPAVTRVLLDSLKAVAHMRPAGYLEDVLSRGRVDGDALIISYDQYAEVTRKYSGVTPMAGPGTVLMRSLAFMGFKAGPGCKCLARASQMDLWGWAECAKPDKIDQIVQWLAEAASEQQLPFMESTVRATLSTALVAGATMVKE